jgi:Rps23 Pro-64 3,4-dihydroxylase Tpa1-like proline 4-hydroxylase
LIEASKQVHWVKAHVGHYKDDELIGRRLDLEARDVEVGQLERHFDTYVEGFSALVSTAISQNLGIGGLVVDDFMLSRYVAGCHIKAHSDTGVFSTSRVVTAVQYLNDAYSGGEIFFPGVGAEVRPDMGDLLLFWSEYDHGVAPVTDGVRFSVVAFGKAPRMLRFGFDAHK